VLGKADVAHADSATTALSAALAACDPAPAMVSQPVAANAA